MDGDLQKAFEWLRKKGQATVMKNNRAANEGLVGVAVAGGTGVLVEVNSETDFVARNADFQAFVKNLAATVLRSATPPAAAGTVQQTELDVAALLKAAGPGGAPLEQELADLVAKIRENISLRRAACLALPPGDGVVAAYVHNALDPALGGAAGLVAIRTNANANDGSAAAGAIQQFGKRLAMHVVAAKPRFLSPAAVPPEVVEYERGLIEAQASGSGKPANIVAKMTEGRLRKFLGELSLLEQAHMIEEGSPRVAEVAAAVGKAQGGCRVEVVGFLRYKTGEVDELKKKAE